MVTKENGQKAPYVLFLHGPGSRGIGIGWERGKGEKAKAESWSNSLRGEGVVVLMYDE